MLLFTEVCLFFSCFYFVVYLSLSHLMPPLLVVVVHSSQGDSLTNQVQLCQIFYQFVYHLVTIFLKIPFHFHFSMIQFHFHFYKKNLLWSPSHPCCSRLAGGAPFPHPLYTFHPPNIFVLMLQNVLYLGTKELWNYSQFEGICQIIWGFFNLFHDIECTLLTLWPFFLFWASCDFLFSLFLKLQIPVSGPGLNKNPFGWFGLVKYKCD